MRIAFDRSEPGAWISGGLHGALLFAAIVGFSSAKLPDADEGIPVEVITDNQFSEMTKGERTAAKVLPDPKPRADRVAETREVKDPGEAKRDAPAPPKRPAEAKITEAEAEPAPAPPPPRRVAEAKPEAAPPPPARPDPPRPDPKLEAAKAAEAKAAAEAEKLAERKEAEALEKARLEATRKAEAEQQKRVADAKAKALAQAKAKAEAEAKARRLAEQADKFSPGDISKLLASKEASQSSGATGREVHRTASLGTATGTSQRLNPSQRDQLIGLLSEQLHRCWQVPIAAQSADKPPVPVVRVKLKQDGSLDAEPVVMNPSNDQLFRTVADSATRATRRCAPLRIPPQFQPFYNDWRDLVVNFDPRQVG